MLTDPVRSEAPMLPVWAARVAWLALALVGGASIGEALGTHSRAVQVTGTSLAWLGWAIVALALLVPSTVSLTVIRTMVPGAVVVMVAAAVSTDRVITAVLGVVLAAVAAVLVASADLGERFVQGSAYGDERRLPLRAPLALLVPAVVSWAVLCAAVLVGPLALAAQGWVVGVPVTLIAVVLGWFLASRFHRLSRRWLVLVPAGVVVHDHVVLSETAMFTTREVRSLTLALADTQAADLTGPAAGHAVEIGLADMSTILLAPTRDTPNGTALHVRSVLVAPTRPGRALSAAARRQLPVG